MFAGHYAPAFALKSRFREVPLWQLFVAVQAVDILFFVLVPLGIERAHVDPTRAGLLALQLDYMPWSHSLLAALVYAGIVAGIGRSRASVALGLAILSHWLCDLPMHTPDLPLAAGDGLRVGLGLWTYPLLAFGFEASLIVACFALYWRVERRAAWLCALLVVVQAVNALVLPLPQSSLALAALSEGSYVAFAAVAWWAERARSSGAGTAQALPTR
jgi:hypothetical protein